MIPKSKVKDSEFEVVGFGTPGINTSTYSSSSEGISLEVQRIYTGPGGIAHKIRIKMTGWSPPYKKFRPRLCYIECKDRVYIADIICFSKTEDGMVFHLKPRC
jgi:hypothetical protein